MSSPPQVRPGAVVQAVPDAAAARRRGPQRGLPPPLPAVRVRRRRRQDRRVARNGLQVSYHFTLSILILIINSSSKSIVYSNITMKVRLDKFS